jgi:hypothetical protein
LTEEEKFQGKWEFACSLAITIHGASRFGSSADARLEDMVITKSK